jgi:hypothetical protein
MSRMRTLARVAEFLGLASIVVAGVVLASFGLVGCGTNFDRFDNSNLPMTPVEELHSTGAAPEVNIEDYRLVVDGLVETPLSLTYEVPCRNSAVPDLRGYLGLSHSHGGSAPSLSWFFH